MKTDFARFPLSSLFWSWGYGLICGLGIAASTVGLLRNEALSGVIWPALIPLLLAPLVILRVIENVLATQSRTARSRKRVA